MAATLAVLLLPLLAICGAYAESLEVCSLPPETGMCRGYFPRYFYDPEEGTCKRFIYGGCGGNKNNFKTVEQCEEACQDNVIARRSVVEDRPKTCLYQADPGMCLAYIPSYFFNVRSQQCERFVYGGCQGNENRFPTLEECEEVCKVVHRPQPQAASAQTCRLPAETGPCRGFMIRYFFNHETGQCETFVYGGCRGNENNFKSQAECELECLK